MLLYGLETKDSVLCHVTPTTSLDCANVVNRLSDNARKEGGMHNSLKGVPKTSSNVLANSFRPTYSSSQIS